MALFNIKKLVENAGKSTEGLVKNITDAAEKLPESAKNFNIADSVKDMMDKSQETVESLISKGEEVVTTQTEKAENTKTAINNALAGQKNKEAAIPTRDALAAQKSKEAVIPMCDALHIMYCLMAVDGKITEEEEDKFQEIGIACDPNFAGYRDSLIEECLAASRLETVYGHAFVPETPEDEEDYYNQIHDYVGDLIAENKLNAASGVRAKILLWDLLAIAFSEGDYSANEKRLIRYFAKRAGVEHTVLLEMENTIRTLAAIEREEEWLKSTDRPYRVIEERLNELADRKNTIMQGVNALVAD